MTLQRSLVAAFLTTVVVLASCSAFEHYDSVKPTVAQQDAYDVSWGLPPRKVRGNPRRTYQVNARGSDAPQIPVDAPLTVPAPAPVPAAPAPKPAPASPAVVPSNLR